MTPVPPSSPPEVFTHLLSAAGGGVATGGIWGIWGVWKWLSDRSKAHADAAPSMQQATAALAKVVNEAAEMMFKQLRDEMAQLRERVEGLEEENERCRGENRQAMQRIDSLQAMLHRAGISIPDRLPTIDPAPVTMLTTPAQGRGAG